MRYRIPILQKIIQQWTTRLFPYWCPYCPFRSSKYTKYEKHWLTCGNRIAEKEKEHQALAAIAPKNRVQRRAMAKRAGQIKDWGELNA